MLKKAKVNRKGHRICRLCGHTHIFVGKRTGMPAINFQCADSEDGREADVDEVLHSADRIPGTPEIPDEPVICSTPWNPEARLGLRHDLPRDQDGVYLPELVVEWPDAVPETTTPGLFKLWGGMPPPTATVTSSTVFSWLYDVGWTRAQTRLYEAGEF